MNRLALALVLMLLVPATVALAHEPNSDGGAPGKGCGPVQNVSRYGPVGVSAKGVGCTLAREVASGSVKGKRFERWRCTGLKTRFGHCHGRGVRAGAQVSWYAYH